MKSACPWDPSLSPNRWELIERAMYTNSMLLATAETVPRLISGIPDKVQKYYRCVYKCVCTVLSGHVTASDHTPRQPPRIATHHPPTHHTN